MFDFGQGWVDISTESTPLNPQLSLGKFLSHAAYMYSNNLFVTGYVSQAAKSKEQTWKKNNLLHLTKVAQEPTLQNCPWIVLV